MKSVDTKRMEAVARRGIGAPRSPEEQLVKLDRRLGKDVGARKERRKLLLQLGWTEQMVDLEFPPLEK